MNKVAHYLQEHLSGEVMTSADAREYFSTDGSVFSVMPSMVVYPRGENDIRKATRFTWQLAERGRIIPMTARGLGTDQSGAAIGSGIILAMPAHMNHITELDARSGTVIAEPGINFGKLQQVLHTHGYFLPPYPSSLEYCTLGGAIANNASGEKSLKYGNMRHYVKGLRVVLANGEPIETKRLNKRDLSKKMGLPTLEGEIYRAVDKLIEEHGDVIDNLGLNVSKNSAGYDLTNVKTKAGFDLTPLFIGSQGTLGIITQATLKIEPYNPTTTLIAAFFDDVETAGTVIEQLHKLALNPSALEMVDQHLLAFVDEQHPNQLKGIVDKPFPAMVLLIEFDDVAERNRKHAAKRTIKLLDKHNVLYQMEAEPEAQEQLWKIRHSAAAIVAHSEGHKMALPIIDDGIVPVDKLPEYIEGIYKLLKQQHLQAAIWGHAGNANLRVQPFLDLSEIGDRQKVFRLMDDYYTMVIGLGGSTSGGHSDGRLRGPYLPKLYGAEAYKVFQKLKQIFDPYGTLNPGVKVDVTLDDIKPLLRHEYSLDHLYNHLLG